MISKCYSWRVWSAVRFATLEESSTAKVARVCSKRRLWHGTANSDPRPKQPGDTHGMNAALRGVAHTALSCDITCVYDLRRLLGHGRGPAASAASGSAAARSSVQLFTT